MGYEAKVSHQRQIDRVHRDCEEASASAGGATDGPPETELVGGLTRTPGES